MAAARAVQRPGVLRWSLVLGLLGSTLLAHYAVGISQQQAKLTASDGAASDKFGNAVALSGDTVVVGAAWDDAGGSDSGSIYVFLRAANSWTQQAKLAIYTHSDTPAGDRLGYSVALSGDTVVAGAQGDSVGGTGSG
jgi:hypothetical protein